jgi:hypothetical protein
MEPHEFVPSKFEKGAVRYCGYDNCGMAGKQSDSTGSRRITTGWIASPTLWHRFS